MILLRPSALVWAMLAVPLVLLYLRQMPSRRRRVATGFLWRQVLGDPPASGPWWKWRRGVSAAVHLVVLALVVLAMAEPLWQPPRRIALVIDNSAAAGESSEEAAPLEKVRLLALEHVRSLGEHDQMAVLTAGGRAHFACGLTASRETLEEAVRRAERVEAVPRLDEAVALGRLVLADAGGEVVVLGGGSAPRPARLPGPPLWIWPAAIALLIAVGEWCLCQRRWTC